MIILNAQTIAQWLGGTVQGNPNATATKFAPIEEAQENCLSFLANPKYAEHAYTTKASILLVNTDFEPTQTLSTTLVKVADPYAALATLIQKYYEITVYQHFPKHIEQPSFIDATAKIGTDTYIGAFAYIGKNVQIGNNCKIFPQTYIGDNVKIDDNTIIYAGAKLYYNTLVGKNCIIHANAVIGSDGFGFAPLPNGSYQKIQQIGNVVIKNNVEIGANTCIDRAALGSTTLHEGVKLDNLIQIAHNVVLGEHTAIAAQTGISGSTKLGKYCIIGGQVGLAGHLEIADKTKIGAQSGVNKSVKEPDKLWIGTPIMEHKDAARVIGALKLLPDLMERIQKIESQFQQNR